MIRALWKKFNLILCTFHEHSPLVRRTRMASTNSEENFSPRWFTSVVTASQLFGITAVVLVTVWFSGFRGGFAWNADPGKEFNYHPVLMTIGMIFLYGDAIICYRVFRKAEKKLVKTVHGIIQVTALVFAAIALKAVFDSHNLAPVPTPNMYTLHSWLGIITVSLFGSQLFCGFGIFVWPGSKDAHRKLYMESHVFFGLAIFCLACGTALTGITEKALWSLKGKYSELEKEAYIVNFFGLCIVFFLVLVMYIATKKEWKRIDGAPDRVPLLTGEWE